MSNIVITISREFASGGHEIAKILSKNMGIKMYDKEILDLAAEKSGLDSSIIEHYDEKPTNSFLYSLSLGGHSYESIVAGVPNLPLIDKVFSVQTEIIRNAAKSESCVIVGRCAESILREQSNVLSVFIHADIELRARRVAEFENITYNKAYDIVKKSDKRRASYHNYFSDSKWGDARSYDLCINSEIGTQKAAELIQFYAEKLLNKQ